MLAPLWGASMGTVEHRSAQNGPRELRRVPLLACPAVPTTVLDKTTPLAYAARLSPSS